MVKSIDGGTPRLWSVKSGKLSCFETRQRSRYVLRTVRRSAVESHAGWKCVCQTLPEPAHTVRRQVQCWVWIDGCCAVTAMPPTV